jgi:hypothetical protein
MTSRAMRPRSCPGASRSAWQTAKRRRTLSRPAPGRSPRAEGIDGLPTSVYRQAVAASQGNMRRVLQRIESGIFKADALAALEREFEM